MLVQIVQKGKNLFIVSFCENHESLMNSTHFIIIGWLMYYTKEVYVLYR